MSILDTVLISLHRGHLPYRGSAFLPPPLSLLQGSPCSCLPCLDCGLYAGALGKSLLLVAAVEAETITHEDYHGQHVIFSLSRSMGGFIGHEMKPTSLAS